MKKQRSHAAGEIRAEMILSKAKSLFAKKGFDGVSMRDLAAEVGITPPTLYHYFPTKLDLQIATLVYAQDYTPATAFKKLSENRHDVRERLYGFIHRLCERFHEDPEFLLLLERALVDRDKKIRDAFSNEIFNRVFLNTEAVLSSMVPNFDKHLLTCFIYGLVVHTYKLAPVRRGLPGYEKKHEDPKYIADNIMKLLSNNILDL